MTIPLIVCLVGLSLWCTCSCFENFKQAWLAEVGRLGFFAGLLVWLSTVAGVKLF